MSDAPRTPEEWASLLRTNWEERGRSTSRDFYIASHPGWDDDAAWAQLDRTLTSTEDPETQNQLLWRAYVDALYFAGFGDRERARQAVARGRNINAAANELIALSQALADPEGEGPIDITPFVAAPLD